MEILYIKDQAWVRMKLFFTRIWMTTHGLYEKIISRKKKMEKMILLPFSVMAYFKQIIMCKNVIIAD